VAETVELLRRAGGEMTGIAPIDLTDPEQARKMVEDAVVAYGRLDVVYRASYITGANYPVDGGATAW
jgi:NAD(P)-dependent dehydrogenase (short-subunit alcohol dehydrogenase family)